MVLYYNLRHFSRGFCNYLNYRRDIDKENIKMKEKITLVVSGIKITVVTDNDPDYVKGLGRLLERRVSDLVISSTNCSKNEALLLCALDYLDEKIKLEKENEELKKALEAK